ncbi:MAG: hypothetical protein LBG48_02825 [Rickettsiales bacterium]|nr:hypothetical protein [Rickettsiales bacterium]
MDSPKDEVGSKMRNPSVYGTEKSDSTLSTCKGTEQPLPAGGWRPWGEREGLWRT